MHRTVANTLSGVRTEWDSWSCTCSFLAHLNDLEFYKGLDEQCDMCIAPWASAGRGQHQLGAVCGDLAAGREHLTDHLGKAIIIAS